MYGKDIDRHRDDRDPAQNGDQDSHDDEGVGTAECEPDDPHEIGPLLRQYSEHGRGEYDTRLRAPRTGARSDHPHADVIMLDRDILT